MPATVKNKKKKAPVLPKLRIKLRSYDSRVIDKACRQIVDICLRSDVSLAGPIPLPTEVRRYTVNRSTFVHKDSREQFEMRTHKRLIEIIGPNQNFVDSLRSLTLPAGVEIEVKTLN